MPYPVVPPPAGLEPGRAPADLMAYLTAGQTARQLGVSLETVRLAREKGQLKAVATPLGFLYHPADVRAYARTR